MTGIEYMNNVCPTTKNGKDPNREDVADAFEDGIAEGFSRFKKQFIEKAVKFFSPYIQDNSGGYDRANVIENFRNYVKEE